MTAGEKVRTDLVEAQRAVSKEPLPTAEERKRVIYMSLWLQKRGPYVSEELAQKAADTARERDGYDD